MKKPVKATRDKLHQLIDELPDGDLELVQFLLEHRHDPDRDPFLFNLATAPYDDEPSSPEEDAEAAAAWEEYRRGRFVSAEEAKRELLS